MDGSPNIAAWMAKAVHYVREYGGENLLVDEIVNAEEAIAAEAENALSRSQGRWIANPDERRVLEDYGVEQAMAYFRRAWYTVRKRRSHVFLRRSLHER